jgi:hypothetical protein
MRIKTTIKTLLRCPNIHKLLTCAAAANPGEASLNLIRRTQCNDKLQRQAIYVDGQGVLQEITSYSIAATRRNEGHAAAMANSIGITS